MNKKLLKISRWTLVVLLGLLFVSSGYPKLMPNEGMIVRFSNWGYAPWFASLVGVIELLGGIALFIPKATLYAAAALVVIMIGATYTHFATGIGSPLFAVIALVLLAATAWLSYSESK